MGLYRKRRARLVVSPSPWSVNTVLLVTVFVVTSGLVYHWAQRTNNGACPQRVYTATASIRHVDLPDDPTDAPHRSPSDDLLARVDQQIRSRPSLEDAVLSATPEILEAVGIGDNASATATIDRLQEGIVVSLEEAGAGQTRLRISYADRAPEQASRLLQAVVQRYARAFRREWKEQTEAAHVDVSKAAEQARLQWQLAEAERQEFVDRFLRDQEEEAQQGSPVQVAPAPLIPPAAPTRLENPEWSRLSERLVWLERRHAEMLVIRTPVHPEVQELAFEIAEVQQALSEVPQWIVAKAQPILPEAATRPAVLPTSPPPGGGIDPERIAREHANARRQLDQLGQKAEQARQRYEQLAAAERAAWSAHMREPEVDTTLSPAVKASSNNPTMRHMLSTSLLAGMAMMVGVGLFAAGAAMEPTLNSAGQAGVLLDVPVVATVNLPGLRPAKSGRHRAWLRLASCFAGVVLVSGCLGLLYQAIAG